MPRLTEQEQQEIIRYLEAGRARPADRDGQRGTGHVNCKSNEYVIQKMQDRGFKLTDDYNELRSVIVGRKFGHFHDTILTFKKEQ